MKSNVSIKYEDEDNLVLETKDGFLVLDDVYVEEILAVTKGEGKKQKIIKPFVPAENGEHRFKSFNRVMKYINNKKEQNAQTK